MPTNTKIIGFLLLIVLITLSYYWIDRQLVWFLVAHDSRQLFGLKFMANDITHPIGAFVFLFYIYFAIRLEKLLLNKTDKKLIIMCNSIVITVFLKDILKMVFGRYWADTFICNNPSLVHNDVYGFNGFTTGDTFASFPSGHAAFIFSFSTSMWILFPKLRWLWCLLAALVVIGQAGMYYHFISDILAGAALGTVVAIYNYRYWQNSVSC